MKELILFALMTAFISGQTVFVYAFFVSTFSQTQHQARRHQVKLESRRSQQHLTDDEAVASTNKRWAEHALLFSSWTDGVVSNNHAQTFLKYALTRKMLSDKIHRHENEIKLSAEFSPCNGPDVNALNSLETVDTLVDCGKMLLGDDSILSDENVFNKWSNKVLQYLHSETDVPLSLRILYIPTAMYALNPSSSNTPGKQRQRARADGKKRRDLVTNLIDTLFNENDTGETPLNTCAITLDLDDGSLKQPVGFLEHESIPKDARTALTKWNPHLIYVEGGNTFWLQHCVEKGGYSGLIQNACTGETGSVYCGKSAGAIIAGCSIETATWKGWDDPSVVPGKERYDQWIGCDGLGFAEETSFFPHYSIDWEDLVKEKTKTGPMSGRVEVLHEDAVLCILGESKKKLLL